ncbi:transglycosylase domain-containing protein [Porphyrobacter sp. AAP82]|uniref:transglycosylase domain-containing protein n=1 Tax=Porphyrobacter sp. AAP82 TaxID=1248917 RepID=UPI0009D978E6|nr:PBP1A family penicillin-binding protein [Porphyrobacter sp. AAP82]
MSRRGDELQNKGARGKRRAAAERSDAPAPRSSGSGSGASSGRGAPPPRWRVWLKRLVIWGGALAVLGLVFLGFAVGFAASSLPDYATLQATQPGQTILVRARDGRELVEIGPSFGEWMTYENIPETMTNAMIAVEDKRFRSHIGVDPVRLTGALVEGITGSRERLGGTSTITQQLARNLFLNNNRSLDRKAREAVLAMALEWKFSKEQILELYLNKVYFGGGAYGIDSASRKFFSHPATELNVGEAAIIAGLVKAPSQYSPTADVQAAIGRAKVVLGLMREQGYITSDQAQVDVSAVQLKQDAGQNSVRYFTDWVLPQLDIILPETYEPIEVWTTLDIGMQRAATAAIEANTPKGAQGALVSLDRDGAILAMVGGTDYVASNYNRATAALRQPGSAWKLFVYLAALEAGYTPEDKVVDTPVTIDGWSPRNSNGRNVGETDLRTAFAYSINTVAAQLGNEVGFGTVASMARRFGVNSKIDTFPSMVLGSSEMRVIEMTQAFAGIAAKGVPVEPYGITKVTGASGEVLYKREAQKSSPAVPDHVVAGITDLLQAAVQTGTGRAAQIGRPVAGKTGTTSSNKDGWFIGFSSGVTTGVWIGRDDAKAVGGLQGGRAPAQAFAAYMRAAVKNRPVEEFDVTLELPEWQLEPDQEALFGEPEDYYYIDEQGNMVQPGTQAPDGGERDPDAAPAASRDFLEEATGGSLPQNQRPPRRPAQQSQPAPGSPDQ